MKRIPMKRILLYCIVSFVLFVMPLLSNTGIVFGQDQPTPGQNLPTVADVMSKYDLDSNYVDQLYTQVSTASDTSAVSLLQQLRVSNHPLSDAVAAEILFKCASVKRWPDVFCTEAAELLDSTDPFAVALAEWSLAIRVGFENSNQTERWSENMPSPPQWYSRWLKFPVERFPEVDYIRTISKYSVHRSLTSLKSCSRLYMARASKSCTAAGTLQSNETVIKAMADAQKLVDQIQQLPNTPEGQLTARQKYVQLRKFTRTAVMATPTLDFQEILFTKRHSVHGLRNITGSQYPFSHKPGGDLCVKSGFEPSSPVRGVLNGQLGPGHVHGTDLHRDGQRIVFGYACQPTWPLEKPTHQNDAHWFFALRHQTPPLHIYEVRLDGSGLRQITDHPYWGDFEPTYAADGSIVFASDRSGRSSECGNFNADHTVINLYRCNADGSDLRMISDNKDIDRYPHALDNGLIGYTRWEYQERHFFDLHSFWTVRPDGTYAEAAFKQHFSTPYGLRDTRSIPNSNKYVSIAAGHHTLAYGQVVLFDLLGGANDSSRLYAVTPNVTPGEGPSVRNVVPQGGVVDNVGRFAGPYPLSETTFLVSYSSHVPGFDGRLGGDTMFGIYLIDVFGNKELIHRDRIYSCDFPTPVKRRAETFNIADGRMSTEEFPYPICYINDVHEGLPASAQGCIKYIRIMQHIGWPLDEQIGAMRYIPRNAWDREYSFWSWSPAREIGLVPVEKDGSANFYVPANQAVYFQALDENMLEVRRMRSHISLENGESRGCIGCHETQPRVVSPKPGSLPIALGRTPSLPKEPEWGSENLYNYETMIQPIFDRNCVECHNDEKPQGGLNLAGTIDQASQMFVSYLNLFPDGVTSGLRPKTVTDPVTGQKTQQVPMVWISDRHSNNSITQIRQFGSSRSQLIRTLFDDELHDKDVRPAITPEDWYLLVSWIDANAPYYDTFFNRRPAEGPAPIRNIRKTFPVSIHEE